MWYCIDPSDDLTKFQVEVIKGPKVSQHVSLSTLRMRIHSVSLVHDVLTTLSLIQRFFAFISLKLYINIKSVCIKTNIIYIYSCIDGKNVLFISETYTHLSDK